MARIRSVKPEFWTDEDIAELSRDARLLYIALWNLADEHGRLRGDARYVKGQVFPYDDDLSAKKVDALLDELAKAGKAHRYVVDGRKYLHLPTLAKHQRLDADKVPSRLPEPTPVDVPTPPPAETTSADESGKIPDNSAPRPDESAPSYVAGSREHGAGSKEQVAGSRGTRANPRAADSDFDHFWDIYPRKVAKDAARKAWSKALERASPEQIVDGARRYRDDRYRDPHFTAHPATWLNAGRWDDEPTPRPAQGQREFNGLLLNDRTINDLQRRDRLAAMDAAESVPAIERRPA